MSGFGTIIGFMFSFLVIITIFFSAFQTYQKQVIIQSEMLAQMEENSATDINFDFEVSNPYYESGRLNLNLKNTGNKNVEFISTKENENCFDFYLNEIYINNDNSQIHTINNLGYDYSIIEPEEIGNIVLKTPYNESLKNKLQITSCDGKNKDFFSTIGIKNWWNYDWSNRKNINFTNNALKGLVEYQAEINLNSSNINFTIDKNDIRFLLPTSENLILDLTFDSYSQVLEEFSKNSLNAYLGANAGTEGSDPSRELDGVILGALSFDGTNDFVSVPTDTSLEVENQMTISVWTKWDETGGGNTQSLFTNGNSNNALNIINDGGVNDNKVEFSLEINGVVQTLYSNSLITNEWTSIVASYDENYMRIYINGKLDANKSAPGQINTQASTNYIGTNNGAGNFYNGLLDEVKVFNIVLTDSEIDQLASNYLRFRELDYYIAKWDTTAEEATIFVKVPFTDANSYTNFEMYYNNNNVDVTTSDIESTFSYLSPKTVGYVLSSKILSGGDLTILSLYDNNNISVGSSFSFLMDEQDGNVVDGTLLNLNDEIKANYLFQAEGLADNNDMITPISWAGTKFYFNGFRNGADEYCMISPWGTANVEIHDNGATEWSGNVDGNGICVVNNINTNLQLISDIPILVSYRGSNQDSFSLYPATDLDLYGAPSQTMYLAAGPLGATVNREESGGGGPFASYNLGVNGSTSDGGQGNQGQSVGFKLMTDFPIGAIQEADSDGGEATVFAPLKEFGVKFGANRPVEYISIVSNVDDANCSVYDNLGTLVGTDTTGVGLNGIYKYEFNVGNSAQYAAAGWKLECDKPVWPYYEEDTYGIETNLRGHVQMRQYIYPEPSIVIN